MFGAGTVQWSWGLDGSYTGKAPRPDHAAGDGQPVRRHGRAARQLISGLTAATASTDTTRAHLDHLQPRRPGPTVADGTKLTVSGTATDTGGGVVAGVEVSGRRRLDLAPATRRRRPPRRLDLHLDRPRQPADTSESRAVDDSGNLETPTAGTHRQRQLPVLHLGPERDHRPRRLRRRQRDRGRARSSPPTPSGRSPACASTSSAATPAPTSATCGPPAGSCWPPRPSAARPPPGGRQSPSPSRCWSTPAPSTWPSYFAPSGHYAESEGYMNGTPRPSRTATATLDSRPLHLVRQRRRQRERPVQLRQRQHLPDQHVQRARTTGSTSSSPPRPRRVRSTNVVASPGYGSAGVTWTAPSAAVR